MLVKILAWILTLTFAGLGPTASAQTITVAWRDKPPFHYIENGTEKGPLLLRAKQVFALAGIEARFVREPSKRIWANFQARVPNYCSFGWYRLQEREDLVQFSVPMQTDLPHSVIFAADAQHAALKHATLASLLADPTLTMGVVDGVSYGPQLDALIRGSASRVVRRTVDPGAMVRMMGARRFDFMFVDRDDWAYARERAPQLNAAAVRDYPDAPAGLQRYVVCSRDLAPELMERINAALDATAVKPRGR